MNVLTTRFCMNSMSLRSVAVKSTTLLMNRSIQTSGMPPDGLRRHEGLNQSVNRDNTIISQVLFHSTSTEKQDKEENTEKKVGDDLDLKDNIYTIPNLLCVSRAAASPFVAHLILAGRNTEAFGLLFVAGLTDLFDGMIARRWPSQASRFGTALDPVCDKILMTTVVVAETSVGMLPWQLAAVMIGRDVGLVLGGFWYRYLSLAPPVTLHKFFDGSHGATEFHPTMLGKVNTCLQLLLIGSSLVYPLLGLETLVPMVAFQYLVGSTTVLSGLQYVTSNTAVQLHKR